MKKIVLFLFFPICTFAQYTGTASVTQGLATTTTSNLYTCTGGRISAVGTITASDATTWMVPAVTNFTNTSFPFASDLNNACDGNNYATSATALAALNGSDIVTIDATGEIITAYVFSDNYFEMYINGIPVGKDKVPYTQFNSSIVRFKVNRPFSIAMLLVDWEERMGVGAETNGGFTYHIGDGGMVAVFKDANNTIIEKTGSDWKAQTFYTAPIMNLTCPTENGTLRLSANCSTADSNSGSNYYGLHWVRPANWTTTSFNDSTWPNATTYSNTTIGVDNKPAYTNFTNIFDDVTNDAQFIWSTNVVLDNEVIVRKTVASSLSTNENNLNENQIKIYPNPAKDILQINLGNGFLESDVKTIAVYDIKGSLVSKTPKFVPSIDIKQLAKGTYFVKIQFSNSVVTKKLVVK